MTVENDGLSQTESAAHEAEAVAGPDAGVPVDPPTEMLPVDATPATKAAAADAAARRAELGMAVTPLPPDTPPRDAPRPPVDASRAPVPPAPAAPRPPAAPPPNAATVATTALPAPPPPPAVPQEPPAAPPDQATEVLPLDHHAVRRQPRSPGTIAHGHVERDPHDDEPARPGEYRGLHGQENGA
jgi:hypothetical protein